MLEGLNENLYRFFFQYRFRNLSIFLAVIFFCGIFRK